MDSISTKSLNTGIYLAAVITWHVVPKKNPIFSNVQQNEQKAA